MFVLWFHARIDERAPLPLSSSQTYFDVMLDKWRSFRRRALQSFQNRRGQRSLCFARVSALFCHVANQFLKIGEKAEIRQRCVFRFSRARIVERARSSKQERYSKRQRRVYFLSRARVVERGSLFIRPTHQGFTAG